VILERQASIKPKQTSARKRAFTLLITALADLTACTVFLDVYLLRELLLPVACAGLLVFLGQTLRCMGFCFMRQGEAFSTPYETQKREMLNRRMLTQGSTWVRLWYLPQ